jgi:predicted DNA binding protein
LVAPEISRLILAVELGPPSDRGWELRLRFTDHRQLRQFNERCIEKEINLTLQRIYNPHVPPIQDELTSIQWHTLAVAYELGYFAVPRKVTLGELAEHLGVSKQAVSQRLRRATRTVVGMLLHQS